MPTINFDLYCNTCGNGICSHTSVSGTTVTVECPTCANKITNLEDEVSNLEEKITDLEEEIESLECDIEDLKEDQ